MDGNSNIMVLYIVLHQSLVPFEVPFEALIDGTKFRGRFWRGMSHKRSMHIRVRRLLL